MNTLELFGLLFVISFVIFESVMLVNGRTVTHRRTYFIAVVAGIFIGGIAELSTIGIAMVYAVYITVALTLLVSVGVSFLYTRVRKPSTIGVEVIAVLIVVIVLIVGVGAFGGIHTASQYNSDLTVVNGASLFSNESLPYDKIPIVSEQYASYIATSHLSDFGGNVHIVDNEMIVYNGSPYWIFSIAPTNVFAVNHLVGYVLVNAVDANFTELFQNSWVGAGLWLLSSAGLHTYINNVEYTVGNHYPQPAPNGQIDYVVTLDSYNYAGVTSFGGGVVYSPDGTVVSTWSGITGAPSWINQPWDKTLLDSLISNWAGDRTGNNSFGFFASGFAWIKASPYMMTVDNGSELIPYHGDAAYMQFLSPASNVNGLGGVMLATGGHIYFYNMEGMSMISASAARATVQAKLPALSGATYFTANPVLYPVGKYFAWIIPYYSQEASTNIVQLQGVGIVDAENSAHFVDIQSQFASVSTTGVEKLMSNAIETFLKGSVTQNLTNTTKVTGIISEVTQFDQNGSTIVALQLNNTSWYFASASNLSETEMASILTLQVGEGVTLTVIGNQIYGFTPKS